MKSTELLTRNTMNILNKGIYVVIGMLTMVLLLSVNQLNNQRDLSSLRTVELPASEEECQDVNDFKFTCVFNASVNNYWENVFPSKQCEGIPIKKLIDVQDYEYATGSMRPYIYKGDTILVTEYDKNKELVLGDVVSNGKKLHRIVGINEKKQTYTTKGDNNYNKDSQINKFEDTEFVVCGVLRG